MATFAQYEELVKSGKIDPNAPWSRTDIIDDAGNSLIDWASSSQGVKQAAKTYSSISDIVGDFFNPTTTAGLKNNAEKNKNEAWLANTKESAQTQWRSTDPSNEKIDGSTTSRIGTAIQTVMGDYSPTVNKAIGVIGKSLNKSGHDMIGQSLIDLAKNNDSYWDDTRLDAKADFISWKKDSPRKLDIAGGLVETGPYIAGAIVTGGSAAPTLTRRLLGNAILGATGDTVVGAIQYGDEPGGGKKIVDNALLGAAGNTILQPVTEGIGKGAKALFGNKLIDTKIEAPSKNTQTLKVDPTDESVANSAWDNFKGKKIINPSLQQSILEDAKKGLGAKYVWGGESCKGWDCSGYVQTVFKNNGINLPRTAHEQFKIGKSVAKEDLQVGDLVFFNNGKRAGLDATHVGIYMGNGKILNAKNQKAGTVVSNISDFGKQYVGAKRVLDNANVHTPHIVDDIETPKVDIEDAAEAAPKTAAQKLDEAVKANEASAKRLADEYDHDTILDVLKSQEKLKNTGSKDYDPLIEETYKKARDIKKSITSDTVDDASNTVSPSTQLYRSIRDTGVEDPVANMDIISSRADAMGTDIDTLLTQKPVSVRQGEVPSFQDDMGKSYSNMSFDELAQHPRYQELVDARKDIAADKTKYDNIRVQKPASYYDGNGLVVQGGQYTRNYDADFRLTKADVAAIQKGKITPAITQKLRDDLGRLESDPIYSTAAAQKDGKTVKGQIDFTKSEAVITLFKDADVTTLPHELGHYFRQTLNNAEKAEAERIFGVKNGVWDDAAEEKFANGFVSFLESGEAPTPILKNVFEKFRNWIKEVWDNAYYKSDDKDFVLTAEHKLFFRAIFGDKEAAAKLWGESAGKSAVNESKTLYSIASFGLNHPKYKGKPKEAIDFLMQNKKGQVVGAMSHPDVGDIDFVYGDTNRGLKHIYGRRLDQWGDEDKVKRFMSHIPEIISESKIDKEASTQSRIVLRSPKSTIILDNGLYGKDKVWMLSGWVEHKNKKLFSTSETIDSGGSQIRADSSDRQANLTEPVLSNDTTIPKNTDEVKSTVYHTSSSNIESLTDDKILWTSPELNYSLKYGKDGSRMVYRIDTSKLNILDGYSVDGIKVLQEANKHSKKPMSDIINEDGGVSSFAIKDKNVIDYLRSKGYDAVKTSDSYSHGTEAIGILSPNKVNFEKIDVADNNKISKQQWQQNLLKWHKDSHPLTKNSDGSPKVLYHGTTANFDKFDIEHFGKTDEGYAGKGFYFTNEPFLASDYATKSIWGEKPNLIDGGNVMPVYINLKNPYINDVYDISDKPLKGYKTTDEIKAMGHDGVIVTDSSGIHEYVVFRPNQVKSIHNKGTFDPYEAKILDQAVKVGKNKNITIDDIKETLENHRGVYKDVPYTRKNWNKAFPDNIAETPLGKVKLGEKQFEKLDPNVPDPKNTNRIKQDRRGHIGYIEQTLKYPAIALKTSDDIGEKLLYFKGFETPKGIRQYVSVIIDKDGLNISVSNYSMGYKQMLKEIKSGEVIEVYGSKNADEVTTNQTANPDATSSSSVDTTIPKNTDEVNSAFEPKSLSQEAQNDIKQKISDVDKQIDNLSKADERIAYAKRRIEEISRNRKPSALTLRALDKNKTNLEALEERVGIAKLKQEKAKLLGQKYEPDIKIAAQYGGWIRNKFDSVLSFFANKPFVQKIVTHDLYNAAISLHNLKSEKGYNFAKEELDMHINELRSSLEELYHGLNSMSMDARVSMYRYMTGEKADIPDALKTVADDMRREIDELGQKLVDEGILDQKTYDIWKATYLHRLYQPKMTKASISKMFKDAVTIEQIFERGKKTIFKPEELGDIKEYMYSVGYDWRRLDHANTLEDIMEISKEKSIADGGIELTEMANGKIKARIDYTKAERAAMGEVEDIAVVLPQTLLKLHTMVYHSEFLRSLPQNIIGDTAKFTEKELESAGYKQLVGQKYGFLNGKWVKKEVAKDIAYSQKQFFGEESGLLKLWDAYYSVFKKSLTVWNPVGHFNNFVGNFMFQAGGGVPLHESIKNVGLGIKAAYKIEKLIELKAKAKVSLLEIKESEELASMIRDKNLNLWYELRAKGVFGRNGLNDILQKSILATEDITHNRGKIQGATDAVYRGLKYLDDTASKFYGLEDDVHRFAMAKHFIEKKGLTVEEAMHEVNKNIPDYSASMTTVGSFLRRTFTPFYSFTYHATPIMLRQMYEHPGAAGMTLGAMLSLYAINGINPFDESETPQGYGFRRIPIFKNGDKVHTLKVDKIIPHMDLLNWVPFTNEKNSIIPENLRTLPIGGLPTSIIGWMNNHDFYYGKPITRQTGAEGFYQLNVKYPIQKLLPSPGITDSLWDLAESRYKNKEKRRNDDTTEPRSHVQEFWKLVGINTMTYHLERLKDRTEKEKLKETK